MLGSDFPAIREHHRLAVDDVDEAVAKVEQAGGQVLRPKFEVGDIGLSAYYTDAAPRGNVFGVWQSERSASETTSNWRGLALGPLASGAA